MSNENKLVKLSDLGAVAAELEAEITALDNGKADVIISTASGPVASFSDGADGLPVEDLIIAIEPVQSGSGDPSPSNVRPISGFTGANVTRTGKNLLPESEYTTKESGTNSKYVDCYFNFSAGSSIKLTAHVADGSTIDGGNCQVQIMNGNTVLFNMSPNGPADVKTFNSNTIVNKLHYYTTNSLAGKTVKLQLELGSTATTYEPYTGSTIPISWQSEAGTVYGGTLDVTTGLLTVTHANIASYNGETLPGKWISSMEVYAAGTTPTTGAQVVYELAEAQTYQLTPNEVKTLLGYNNIWVDTGDTTVEYRADSGLFIAKETAAIRSCIAPTEDGATASQAYAQGKYFFHNGSFCKAKTAIASGATFTLGTNYEVTTVAAELYNALNT